MPKKKKSETEILFPNIEVDGITVKPWSFGMLFELSTHLANVIEKCEEKEIDKIFKFDKDNLDIKIVDAIKLLHIAGPEIRAIIGKTISYSEEEITGLDMGTGIKLAIAIFNQNKESIKNALTPLLEMLVVGEIEEEINQD
jgi:hypothetical protein